MNSWLDWTLVMSKVIQLFSFMGIAIIDISLDTVALVARKRVCA